MHTVSFWFLAAAASLGGLQPHPIKISAPEGPYTVAMWKNDWPGCPFQDGVKEGHLSVLQMTKSKGLRVSYSPGQIGPEKGGCGWRYPFGQREVAELRYTVRFSKDFDWVKGGKLPGLSGGPDNVSGGRPATGQNGFSARLMWRREGRGEAYVYHVGQPEQYGESFSFPNDFRFPTETDIQIRIRVEMNEPNKKNGKLRVWAKTGPDAPEHSLVHRTDLQWRTVPSFGVDSVYFESFHGGSDGTWAPTRPCCADFGSIRVDY
jgi:hypothetical protein